MTGVGNLFTHERRQAQDATKDSTPDRKKGEHADLCEGQGPHTVLERSNQHRWPKPSEHIAEDVIAAKKRHWMQGRWWTMVCATMSMTRTAGNCGDHAAGSRASGRKKGRQNITLRKRRAAQTPTSRAAMDDAELDDLLQSLEALPPAMPPPVPPPVTAPAPAPMPASEEGDVAKLRTRIAQQQAEIALHIETKNELARELDSARSDIKEQRDAFRRSLAEADSKLRDLEARLASAGSEPTHTTQERAATAPSTTISSTAVASAQVCISFSGLVVSNEGSHDYSGACDRQ